MTLPAFSASLSFASDGTDYEGVFTLKDGKTMQLMLRTPAELQGLRFVYENKNAFLRFGEASLSLADAETLGLPPAKVHALFEALSVFCEAPQTLLENGGAEVTTSRGTATVFFAPETPLPQSVKLGNSVFTFRDLKTDPV